MTGIANFCSVSRRGESVPVRHLPRPVRRMLRPIWGMYSSFERMSLKGWYWRSLDKSRNHEDFLARKWRSTRNRSTRSGTSGLSRRNHYTRCQDHLPLGIDGKTHTIPAGTAAKSTSIICPDNYQRLSSRAFFSAACIGTMHSPMVVEYVFIEVLLINMPTWLRFLFAMFF